MNDHVLGLLAAVGIAVVATGCQTPSSEESITDFVSETLTTKLIPAPYVIDTSPTGEFGLNGMTWYVNGDYGNDASLGTSEATAFKTIQNGIESSGPGDKIYVMDGTYRFEEDSPTQSNSFYAHSGNAAHWILLAACPGHHPKLEFSWYDCISIQGSSYIIVSGFTI
jgi:hypothetical protein